MVFHEIQGSGAALLVRLAGRGPGGLLGVGRPRRAAWRTRRAPPIRRRQGARGHQSRRYAEAEALLKPLAARTPDGEAALELGLLYQMLGPSRRSRWRCSAASPTCRSARARRRPSTRGLAAPRARWASFNSPTTRIASPPKGRRAIPSLHTGWGELFLQAHNNAEAAKSFQDALEADEQLDSGARSAWRRRCVDENPPAAMKPVEQALALDPDVVQAHLLLGAARARQERSRSGQGGDREGEGDQPGQPRRACAERRHCVRRRSPERLASRGGGGAEDQPAVQRRVSRGGRAGGLELPLRRSGGAEPQGARRSIRTTCASHPALGVQLLRTGRRSRSAAACSRRRSRSTSSIRRRSTC